MNTIDLEKNFFDRTSILNLLNRRVVDLKEGYRQNLAFLGNRYIGKTSILQKFSGDLEDDEIIEIYLELDRKDFKYLFHKTVGSILYNFSKAKKLPLHEDLALLIENTKKFLPQTIEAIKKVAQHMEKGKIFDAYLELINLPEIFTFESNKFCIIILDEFHNLEELGAPDVFQELGKRIMTQKRCLYIVTSSLSGVAKDILSEKLSLLFGNFEVIEILPFDLKTSQGFVRHNLADIKISSYLRNFLIDFASGHPFYLNIISQEMIHLCAIHKQEEVFLPLLTQALENTIFNRWGILSRHFELTTDSLCQGKANKMMSALLISLSNGHMKLVEIAEDIDCKRTAVTQKLSRLMELGIVTKNGSFYYYGDKLFKYWLKYVFQLRLRSFNAGLEQQRLKFKQEISHLVDDFQAISRKDLSSRIIDLLQCFDNEALSMNGRKYKLPLFKEIESVEFKDLSAPGLRLIKASSPEGVWCIVLKEDTLCEGDVNQFLMESRKMKQKPQRHVIISLADLDVNARLKALQEKMWIWNEGELNTLLSLYDKPYIMADEGI